MRRGKILSDCFRRRLSENGKHRTESAEPNDDFVISFWEHTPPLEAAVAPFAVR